MKRVKYMVAVMAVFALAACSNEESTVCGYATDSDAVVVKAGITALETRANTEAGGDAFLAADVIGIENVDAKAVNGKSIGYYVTADGESWLPSNADGNTATNYLVWAEANTFHAWYPSSASFDAFELPAEQSSLDRLRSADWMTAQSGISIAKPENRQLDLAFSHKLAKVTIKIAKYNNQFAGTETLEDAKFFLASTPQVEGVVLPASGFVMPMASSVDAALGDLPSFTAVLLPGTYGSADGFFAITVDGMPLAVKANADVLTGTGLEAGHAYTFTLSVGKQRIEILSVSVSPWETAELGDVVAGEETADTYGNIGLSGSEFAVKMKSMGEAAVTNPQATDQTIKSIRFLTGSGATNGEEIQSADSESPVYMSFDAANGVVTVSTVASRIVFPDDCKYMFCNLKELEEIQGLENVDTSNATNMQQMFYSCPKLKSLALDSFDTGNVTNMLGMFWQCSSISALDVSSFNTEKVISMILMFGQCGSLESIRFGEGFTTKNVKYMYQMFANCTSLSGELDLSNWSVESLADGGYDLYGMFQNCQKLSKIDLSGFNTAALKDFRQLFTNCYSLEELVLGSGFVISEITELNQMSGKDKESNVNIMCQDLARDATSCVITCTAETQEKLQSEGANFPAAGNISFRNL